MSTHRLYLHNLLVLPFELRLLGIVLSASLLPVTGVPA